MIILYQGERANIVCKEEDIKNGNGTIYAMFKNRLYEFGTWKNVNGDDKLYGYVREELEQHMNDAMKERKKVESYFSSPAPVPAPVTSSVGGKLEELLMKVIAEQSVEEIVKVVSPKLEKSIEKSIIDKFGVLPQVHEIKTPTGTHEIKGTVHECFDKVLNLVNLDIPSSFPGRQERVKT